MFRNLLKQEEDFYRQKAMADLVHLGDANTKFSHHFVKMKRAKNRITSLNLENGEIISGQT